MATPVKPRRNYDLLFKLLLIGDSGVGKTCVLFRYADDSYKTTFISTIGIDFTIKTIELEGKKIKLQIWDTAGQERFYTITTSYYRGAMGIVVVYDVTSQKSFDNTRKWFQSVKQNASADVKCLLIGNKCDADDRRVVPTARGEQQAASYGVPFLEVSAKTNHNVAKTFETLAMQILERDKIKHLPKPPRNGLGRRMLNWLLRRKKAPDSHAKSADLPTTDSNEVENSAHLSDLEDQQGDEHEDEAVAKEMTSPDPSIHTEDVKSIAISDLTFGDLLARGGQAVVWKGKWEGKEVAIKRYTNQPDPSDIKILQEIPPHENIVTVYGVVREQISCCIVMKLMKGGSLYDVIHKEKNTPSPEQRFSWMKDIATGMEFLHSRGIAHRDLKSGNVLLEEDDRKTAKLCDFGTARLLDHTTAQSVVKGTYRWMAPEIIMGIDARINRKCDVFSYGMVLYEIVTLELPLKDAKTDQLAMIQVVEGLRPCLPRPGPECPVFLHCLITACWSEEPVDRPSFEKINLALDNETFP